MPGKLGLIAGGGDLPETLARHCREAGRPVFVVRLGGAASAALKACDGVDLSLGELGRAIASLKHENCAAVCMAGNVSRPDFKTLKLDGHGLRALPGVIAAARRGDAALLSHMIGIFEAEGFAVEGAHDVLASLTLASGALGSVGATAEHQGDIAKALAIARAIGDLDIGQGAVVCDGVVLAVEAQEGTDAMLRRVAGLDDALRGSPGARRGVLAKVCKPGQDDRVDMPVIGPSTVRLVAEAGLAGIVGETGRVLVMEREALRRLADDLGVFVLGAP